MGIFESTVSEWDHEFIHLLEEYLADGGAVGIMQPQPSIHRVFPAQGAVKFEQILPYEDVRETLLNPDECIGCQTCIERCQVDAVSEQAGVAVVDRERCIGCGLCATGCPNDVAKLHKKPDAEILHPPADFATWGHERLHNRGLLQ